MNIKRNMLVNILLKYVVKLFSIIFIQIDHMELISILKALPLAVQIRNILKYV